MSVNYEFSWFVSLIWHKSAQTSYRGGCYWISIEVDQQMRVHRLCYCLISILWKDMMTVMYQCYQMKLHTTVPVPHKLVFPQKQTEILLLEMLYMWYPSSIWQEFLQFHWKFWFWGVNPIQYQSSNPLILCNQLWFALYGELSLLKPGSRAYD